MNLDQLQLSPELLAEMFAKYLILPEEKMLAAANTPVDNPPYRFLGSNKKKIVLMLKSANVAFASDSELQFLTRILEACTINLGDVAILNHESRPIEASEIKRQLSPKFALLFGLAPEEVRLPFKIPWFQVQRFDGCQFLSAPALAELNQETAESRILKSKLWICLRAIFELPNER